MFLALSLYALVMSARGHRPSGDVGSMSGLPPKLTVLRTSVDVSKAPEADTCTAEKKARLFDHLVGAGEQCRRDVKAKALRGLEIDHQLEFGGLFDGKIGRFGPAPNPVYIVGGAPFQVQVVWPIGHETSRFDVLPLH